MRNNVIPDTVELEGTIRAFEPDMREQIHIAMERMARSIAEGNGCDHRLGTGAGLTRRCATMPICSSHDDACAGMCSGYPLEPLNPQTVAEDFSEYAEVTPSLFVFLGNWPADLDPNTQPTNHSPLFDMHEPYLETGVSAFGNMVVTTCRALK